MTADEQVVWIRTEPTPDGKAYVATLELDADTAVVLTPTMAREYAAAVIRAAYTAVHDAAVFGQLRALTSDDAAAFGVVRDLRADRAAIDTGTPLGLTPGVSVTGDPFLSLTVNGEAAGQWDVDAAKSHAEGVLVASVVADLDGAYYRVLRGTYGLDEVSARGAVGGLVERLMA